MRFTPEMTPNSEKKSITQFFSNKENVMKRTLNGNIGVILLKLKKYYPIDLDCVNSQVYKELLISEITLSINLLTDHQLSEELLVDFKNSLKTLHSTLNEDFDIYLDKIAYYNVTTGNDEIFDISLSEVLHLIWKALNDNEKYIHNYGGSHSEKMILAENDRKNRILNLFQYLRSYSLNRVCHQGLRNSLVFLLDKSYEDINIIENEVFFVLSYLRERCSNIFFNATPVEKDQLKSGLISWITTDSAQLLLEQSGLTSVHIFYDLKKILLKNGLSPTQIECNENSISENLKNLECTIYQKDPLLRKISILLRAKPTNEFLSNVILNIKHWINDEFKFLFEHHKKMIENYCEIYLAYNLLNENSLLLSFNNGNEKFAELNIYCSDILKTAASSLVDFEITDEKRSTITELKEEIVKLKRDRFYEEIENFFVRWFVAKNNGDKETLRSLFSFLVTPVIQEKITYSKDEICQIFISSESNEKDLNVKEITPYEINRIFLHAIINKIETWDDSFKEAFLLVLKFVEENFNENNTKLARELKYFSYPKLLMTHLQYLKNLVSEQEEVTKPRGMFILPNQIQTPEEWMIVVEHLTPKLHLEICQSHFVLISKVLNKDLSATNLGDRLKSLPVKYRFMFMKNIKSIANVLTLKSLPSILINLDAKDKIKLIQSSQYITNLIKNGVDLAFVANMCHPLANDLIDLFVLEDLVNCGSDLAAILTLVDLDNKIRLLDFFKEEMDELITDNRTLCELLSILPNKLHEEVLSTLKNSLASFNGDYFGEVLEIFSVENQSLFLIYCLPRIKSIIEEYSRRAIIFSKFKNPEDIFFILNLLGDDVPLFNFEFNSILKNIPKKDHARLMVTIYKYLHSMIIEDSQFGYILDCLDEKPKLELLNSLKNVISPRISNPNDNLFYWVLYGLSQQSQNTFIHIFKHEMIAAINENFQLFVAYINLLHADNKYFFMNFFKGELSRFVPRCDVVDIIRKLHNKKEFINTFKEDLAFIINNQFDNTDDNNLALIEIYNTIGISTLFLDIGSDKISIIIKDISILTHFMMKIPQSAWGSLLDSLGDHLLLIVKTYNLSVFIDLLGEDNAIYFIDLIKDKLATIINTSDCLIDLLESRSDNFKLVIIEALGVNIIKIIEDRDAYHAVLQILPESCKPDYKENLTDQLCDEPEAKRQKL